MAEFVPSLPHGIPNWNAADAPTEDLTGLPWTPAPAGSHVWGWRYYDTRRHPLLRRFPGAIGQGRSELHVRFKDPKRGVTNTYVYYFESPQAGQAVADKLAGATHPGEVVDQFLRKAGVPYSRA